MNNEYVLFPIEALAHHVIPCLTREPVVCSNVGDLRVYSSGSQIKFGMTDYQLPGLEEDALFIIHNS